MRELAAAYIGGTDLASLGDRARLFALANTAAADAIICSWNSKKAFNFWRPHQAIRNGGADGNILTEEERPGPRICRTPNYPDYTSGANNVGGSMTRALELFFGSDKPFDTPFRIYALGGAVPLLPTDALYREYSKFSDIAKEIIVARIYLGIHFRFADTEARSQGRRVANHTFKNILQPVGKGKVNPRGISHDTRSDTLGDCPVGGGGMRRPDADTAEAGDTTGTTGTTHRPPTPPGQLRGHGHRD